MIGRCRRSVLIALAVVLCTITRVEFLSAPLLYSFPIEDSEEDAFIDGSALHSVEQRVRLAHPDRNVTVIAIHGVPAMSDFISAHFFGNPFCGTIQELRDADPDVFVVYYITFNCQELFDKACCGTGNFLGLYYGLRLVAEVYGDVEIHFTCPDAEATRQHLILPWVTGVIPARNRNNSNDSSNRSSGAFAEELTPADVCKGVYEQPVGHMVPVIQQDLRRMAVALVGRSPRPVVEDASIIMNDAALPSFIPQLRTPQKDRRPPLARVPLDQAVLHFRCGDLMDSTHWSFAFMNFRGYTRHIWPNTTSIGILTQPFSKKAKQTRGYDAAVHVRDRCRIVVHSLVQYIRERFPNARVRIHNTESIALSYARMIWARQAIAGISTFGVLPAVATFGTGYIRVPDHPMEVNQWVVKPRIDEIVDNVVFIDDPKMPVEGIKALWEQEGEKGVLAWFWNDTWTPEQ